MMSTEHDTFTELVSDLDIEHLRAVQPLSPTGKWTRRDPWIARLYGPTEWVGDCLVRTIGLQPKGYTHIRVGGAMWRAHRLAWATQNGPIPDEMTIDHLCGVTGCIRVAHMEVVTREENSTRRHGWHTGVCKSGHDITDPANVSPAGRDGRGRRCRPCFNQLMRDFKRRAAA